MSERDAMKLINRLTARVAELEAANASLADPRGEYIESLGARIAALEGALRWLAGDTCRRIWKDRDGDYVVDRRADPEYGWRWRTDRECVGVYGTLDEAVAAMNFTPDAPKEANPKGEQG